MSAVICRNLATLDMIEQDMGTDMDNHLEKYGATLIGDMLYVSQQAWKQNRYNYEHFDKKWLKNDFETMIGIANRLKSYAVNHLLWKSGVDKFINSFFEYGDYVAIDGDKYFTFESMLRYSRQHSDLIVGFKHDIGSNKRVGVVILNREPNNYHLKSLNFSDISGEMLFINGKVIGTDVFLFDTTIQTYSIVPVYDSNLNYISGNPFIINVTHDKWYYINKGVIRSISVGGWFEDSVLGECANASSRFEQVATFPFGTKLRQL